MPGLSLQGNSRCTQGLRIRWCLCASCLKGCWPDLAFVHTVIEFAHEGESVQVVLRCNEEQRTAGSSNVMLKEVKMLVIIHIASNLVSNTPSCRPSRFVRCADITHMVNLSYSHIVNEPTLAVISTIWAHIILFSNGLSVGTSLYIHSPVVCGNQGCDNNRSLLYWFEQCMCVMPRLWLQLMACRKGRSRTPSLTHSLINCAQSLSWVQHLQLFL